MTSVASDHYLSLGLTKEEYEAILRALGREPSETELGMFSVQWSEHCSYKCSRSVLAYFKDYKKAIEGDGLENAGVVPIGDGLGIVLKVESHNHPSAVEPYQGAATGVGGIIRDIFTMGARPIALLNSLWFGPVRDGEAPPSVVQRNRYLFDHVVAGIAGYGNCVGVPTVGGETGFHNRYSGNPLVNAMCVGIVRLGESTTAAAAGEGNPVLYLGSATGKDGICGASFASEALDEDSDAKRPNVQIGDPFAEKLLIEATLEALKTGAVQSIQDMGAAGLTCSTTEMSAKGGVGMDIDLDKVPVREPGMTAFELMLSESQERMLCVAHKGREQEVVRVFEKWGLHAVEIGRVTTGANVRVWRNGKLEVDVPGRLFTDGCPAVPLVPHEPESFARARRFDVSNVPQADPHGALLTLLASPNLADKTWVTRQYDQQVLTQTTLAFGHGEAAVVAPRGTKKGLALKLDGSPRWVALDPYVGGLLTVCSAARKVACTGGLPIACTDGLNFGSPKQGHVYWQFERSVRGIADAAEALGTPVVSGNVSFYNESELGEVPPTPLIGMLGVLEDASQRVGAFLPEPDGELALMGYDLDLGPQQGLGASEYLAEVYGIEDGQPVAPDLERERRLCQTLVRLVEQGLVTGAKNVGEGGLAVALALMCLRSGRGVRAVVKAGQRLDAALFGERPGLVLVSLRGNALDAAKNLLQEGLWIETIGKSTDDLELRINDNLVWGLDQMAAQWSSALPGIMAGID